MSYYLAVDAGGTKTHVLLADADLKIIAEAKNGPANFSAVGIKQAANNFSQVVTQVIIQAKQKIKKDLKIKSVVVGMAGLDIPQENKQIETVLGKIIERYGCHHYQFINDGWIALESGSRAANAIVLIAGTGANCLGRAANGARAKANGFDFLLADQGSSYAIGLAALKAATKSFDGRGPKTKLEYLLKEYFKVKDFSQLKLKVYHPNLSKRKIAQLAQLVSQAFAQQDQVAQTIFNQAVKELFITVETVIRDLKLADQGFDLVLIGGLFQQAYIKKQLISQLNDFYPKMNVIFPNNPPVFGALRLASQLKV